MAELPDGSIALKTSYKQGFYAFDPRRGAFRAIKHPKSRIIRLISPRKGGGLWVVTIDSGNVNRLETYDGAKFESRIDLPHGVKYTDYRSICETRSGDVWLGGEFGIIRYSAGRITYLGAGEGYTETSASAIYEKPDGRLLVGGREKLLEFDGKE